MTLLENKMRVNQIVGSIQDEASGPSYSVPRLCKAVSDNGCEVSLYSLGDASDEYKDGVRHTTFPTDYRGIGYAERLGLSSGMKKAIASEECEIIHSHGMWMMPNIYPSLAVRNNRSVFVLSPRGMLGKEALEFSSRKKKAIWLFKQKNALELASCIHATSEQEYLDIRAFGITKPVSIIPNGIDVPPLNTLVENNTSSHIVLSLGRVHPKKGLDLLIKAWHTLGTKTTGWTLKIVGPSEIGYGALLSKLVEDLSLNNVSILPPVFGQDKTDMMANADVFILPTLNENFAMTVAESLVLNTPVISSTGAPWQGLIENDCGWWVSNDPVVLAETILDAMSLTHDQRLVMGRRGRQWMKDDYDWDSIGSSTVDVYKWLRGMGSKPETVVLN